MYCIAQSEQIVTQAKEWQICSGIPLIRKTLFKGTFVPQTNFANTSYNGKRKNCTKIRRDIEQTVYKSNEEYTGIEMLTYEAKPIAIEIMIILQ